MTNLAPIEQAILTALQQGDKNPGSLHDAAKCSYPELFSALKALTTKGRIEFYFSGEPTALTYRLVHQAAPSSWFRRD